MCCSGLQCICTLIILLLEYIPILCSSVCGAADKYGVATISRLLKIIGLFCRISSLLQVSSAKETYNFKEPISRSHPIVTCSSNDFLATRHDEFVSPKDVSMPFCQDISSHDNSSHGSLLGNSGELLLKL